MPFRNDLTAEYVRSLLAYDPETGILTWRVNRRGRFAKIGREAGTPNSNGSLTIGISGKLYYAHRLAWLIMTGEWPPEQIDHKGHNPKDNRWESIRAATPSQNQCNHRVTKLSKSRIKGVVKTSPNRWQAFIRKDYTTYYLGSFKSPEEAAAAYQEAAIRLHGAFAHF